MKDFTQENLNKKEFKEDSYYQYDLKGIIVHVGNADYGHYYSFIKHEGEWFEFNDIRVRKVEYNYITEKTFGSNEKKGKKAESAYLLLYERKKYFSLEKDQTIKTTEEEIEALKFNDTIKKEIHKQEYLDYVGKLLSSESFYNFVINLETYSNDKLVNFKICLRFFLLFTIRQKGKSKIPEIYKQLTTNLKENITSSIYLVGCFRNLGVIFEFLVDCPVQDMSYLIIGLVKNALKKINENWKDLSKNQKETVREFIRKIVNSLILVNNSMGNEQNLLLILESLCKEIVFCRILRNSNFERLLEYNFIGNFKLHLNLGPEPLSDLAQPDFVGPVEDEPNNRRNNNQEYFRTVILRCGVFYYMNLKRRNYPSPSILNVHFWILSFNFVKSNCTNLLLAKFFVKYCKKRLNLLTEVLTNISVKDFNVKTVFFLFKEIATLNNRKINNMLYGKLKLMLENTVMENYIIFDLFVRFLAETCLCSEDFFNLLIEKKSFLQFLINKNQFLNKVDSMKEERVD